MASPCGSLAKRSGRRTSTSLRSYSKPSMARELSSDTQGSGAPRRPTLQCAQKRTIGFMGIGLKTKTNASPVWYMTDSDASHSSRRREKPRGVPAGSFGWVLQPQCCWCTPGTSLTNDWCHFQLEKPREGIEDLKRDLGMLPESVISLLGRSISGGGAYMRITSVGSLGPQLTARELKPCDSGGWSCDGVLAPFLRASLSPS